VPRFILAKAAEFKEEAVIMKDVPGWVVGQRPYHTDTFVADAAQRPPFDRTKF
jgi:hypothetical protein